MPNIVTFICILKVYGNEGVIEKGEENLIAKALIDMYSKCGMIAEAQGLFHTFSCWIVYISTSSNSSMKYMHYVEDSLTRLSSAKRSVQLHSLLIYITLKGDKFFKFVKNPPKFSMTFHIDGMS